MEGYEIYRLSDEEIQHVGVKGMKWGKRKSRSAYMTAVDKHEAKTKANRQKVADHKAREKEQGKAVAKAVGKKYMGAVAKHEAKSKANNEKLAAHKDREKAEGKAAVKKYMDASRAHEEKTKTRRTTKAEKKLAKKDEKWEKKQNPYATAAEAHNRALPKMTKFISELDKKYKNANFDDENDAEAKKYFKEFENEYKKQLNSALNSSPDSVSPSGKKKAQAVMLDYGSFKIEIVDNK